MEVFSLQLLLTAIFTFIATEIDDFALFIILYAKHHNKKRALFFAQLSALLCVSLACCLLSIPLSSIPEHYLRWAGIIPALLGIKAIFDNNSEEQNNEASENKFNAGLFVTGFLLTISASADNAGIYLPYFSSVSLVQSAAVILIFIICQCLWSLAQIKTAGIPAVERIIKKTSPVLVPAVYIILGLMIIF